MEKRAELVSEISEESRRIYFRLVAFISGNRESFLSRENSREDFDQALEILRKRYEDSLFTEEQRAIEGDVWDQCQDLFEWLYQAGEEEIENLEVSRDAVDKLYLFN